MSLLDHDEGDARLIVIIYLSIYPSLHPSIHSISQSINLSQATHLFSPLSTKESGVMSLLDHDEGDARLIVIIYLSIHPFIHSSINQSINLSQATHLFSPLSTKESGVMSLLDHDEGDAWLIVILYLSIYPSLHPSIRSISQSISQSINLSQATHLFSPLSTKESGVMSLLDHDEGDARLIVIIYLSIHPSIHPFIHSSINQSINLSQATHLFSPLSTKESGVMPLLDHDEGDAWLVVILYLSIYPSLHPSIHSISQSISQINQSFPSYPPVLSSQHKRVRCDVSSGPR